MGVARQASTRAAAGLVEELKTESEQKREHELDKRCGVAQERNVGRLIVEIDGDGSVTRVTLAVCPMSHLHAEGCR